MIPRTLIIVLNEKCYGLDLLAYTTFRLASLTWFLFPPKLVLLGFGTYGLYLM